MTAAHDDVTTLLAAARLEALRRAYGSEPGWLAAAAAGRLAGRHPAAAGLLDALSARLYAPGADAGATPPRALREVDRERCLIFRFAQGSREFPLAVHVYWGLALGLGVDEVAEVLLLAGVYSGLDCYNHAMRVLATTLRLLHERADVSPRPAAVLAALDATFEEAVR